MYNIHCSIAVYKCTYVFPSVEDGTEKLLDLSPFDLKHLLMLIFSSKEFTVDESKPAPVKWRYCRMYQPIQYRKDFA